jgi:diguanylate cyclase (GGDEF)-like protein/PAS domain S-box-containing protein
MLLKPAISFMNRISYSKKVLILSLVILLPLVIPAYNAFSSLFSEQNALEKQKIGLKYNKQISSIITDIQQIREKKHSKNIDKVLKKDINELINFDKDNLNYFDKKSLLTQINSLKENPSSSEEIIEKLIYDINNISKKTNFSSSQYNQLNLMSRMLSNKIPQLQEQISQIKTLDYTKMTDIENKTKFIQLYTLIDSNLKDLKDTNNFKNIEDFSIIRKTIEIDAIHTQTLLKTLNKALHSKQYDLLFQQIFLDQATQAKQAQLSLYNELSTNYEVFINKKLQEISKKINILFFSIFAVLLASFYVFSAFYQSTIQNLNFLKEASLSVAKGKFDFELYATSNDEIADTMYAFQVMSENVNQNVAFLDGYKTAIDESSIVSKTNPKGIITYANEKFCDISEYSKEELIGKPHNIVRHPDVPKEAFKEMWETIQSKKVWQGIVKNRKKSGGSYIVDATITPIVNDKGEIIEYVAVRHDITELEKSKELELKVQQTDSLTKLQNRGKMLQDLEHIDSPVLIFININDFGKLNNFYGTKVGDKVLQSVARLLEKVAQTSDVYVYKLHADEFAIIHSNKSLSNNKYLNFVTKVIKFIESYKINCKNGSCINISVTVGIAFSDGNRNKQLLTNANIALKQAKKSNQKYMVYTDSMRVYENYEKNMLWIEKIKNAIKNDRIVIYFQPIIDNQSDTISKYECLVRLKEANGNVVSPFFFLDIAKNAKLYSQITHIVIEKSFKAFENLTDYEFSINLSIEDIEHKETINFIKEKLSQDPKPSRVVFEIVESEEIQDYENISNFIKIIKSFGAKIAIDDFGSGYSNFEHILSLDADYIKVDGSLIKNIDHDKESKIIASAIIAFSRKLNTKTIVEFVHNEAVFKMAKELGADYSQGFYLGEPLPSPSIKLLMPT